MRKLIAIAITLSLCLFAVNSFAADDVDPFAKYTRPLTNPVYHIDPRNETTFRIVNLWQGDMSRVPAGVRRFVSPELISWKDHAVWNTAGRSATWRHSGQPESPASTTRQPVPCAKRGPSSMSGGVARKPSAPGLRSSMRFLTGLSPSGFVGASCANTAPPISIAASAAAANV